MGENYIRVENITDACGGISPRRGESALCTREPLEDEA